MSWGVGPWGSGSPWGTGTALPVPTLIGVSALGDFDASTTGPAAVDFRGGTICILAGTGFFDPTLIEVLSGGPGNYVVEGIGYVVTPEFDLTRSTIYFGAPHLTRDGLYHLRATTDGGVSNVLPGVLLAQQFAEEFKTLSVRGKFAPAWDTGPRLLTNENIGLIIP